MFEYNNNMLARVYYVNIQHLYVMNEYNSMLRLVNTTRSAVFFFADGADDGIHYRFSESIILMEKFS